MLRITLVAALCVSSVWAQQTTATLTGTITDTTGAVVPDVAVRATNRSTNIAREAKTDISGTYTIPFMPAGDWTVTATRAGFRTQRVETLTLEVGQTARVDLQLQVGEVSEAVNVEAYGLSCKRTHRPSAPSSIPQKIVDLPLNGRNFVQLAQLIPGVQAGTPGSITVRRGRGSIGQQDSPFGSTAMSANGSRDTANRYFLDGIEIMDYDAMTYSFLAVR